MAEGSKGSDQTYWQSVSVAIEYNAPDVSYNIPSTDARANISYNNDGTAARANISYNSASPDTRANIS